MKAVFLLLAVLVTGATMAAEVRSPMEVPGIEQLSSQERAQVMKKWESATPEHRVLITRGLTRFFQLSPEKQNRVRERRIWFKGLTRNRQREVCAEFLAKRGRLPYLCQVNNLP